MSEMPKKLPVQEQTSKALDNPSGTDNLPSYEDCVLRNDYVTTHIVGTGFFKAERVQALQQSG